MKNKTFAALLAFFFGGIGLHKFYLGQIGQGFVYVIFCWTFIPAIIGFFESIVYFLESDSRWQRRLSKI